ncbi:MAG: hypothetical protein ACR2HD_01010 [Solirubrobacteraceae bacterium]|nr:MAG: hypothetical protein DLM63_01575 [Solirubrobacterales bacterium]
MWPITKRQLERDIARLADGSLETAEAAAAEARITAAGAPWVRSLQRQRAVVARVHAVAPEIPDAPSTLASAQRERAAGQRARRRRGFPLGARRPFALAGMTAAAMACAAVVTIVSLVGGGGGAGPSVAQAAALGLRTAQTGPPSALAQKSSLLALAQSGVAFPDWTRSFGWRPEGSRVDQLGGRTVTTVFYSRKSRTIAYSIVGGRTLGVPGGSDRERYAGTRLWVSVLAGRAVVTWNRLGHTCVLSGASVAPDALAHLAAWHAHGRVAF